MIPKIHKNLVKVRLIVPFHSIVQTPAGVFISKSLKPIIKSAPFIIYGSKDLVLKLSKLSLPHYSWINRTWNKLFIVLGDVIAFYPYIDVLLAHEIALNEFK